MHHSKPMVLASIVMLSILCGSSFIAIKIVVEGVTPLVAFGMRFFMAGILLIATHYILHYINLKRSNTIDYHHLTIKINICGEAGYCQLCSSLWKDRDY